MIRVDPDLEIGGEEDTLAQPPQPGQQPPAQNPFATTLDPTAVPPPQLRSQNNPLARSINVETDHDDANAIDIEIEVEPPTKPRDPLRATHPLLPRRR